MVGRHEDDWDATRTIRYLCSVSAIFLLLVQVDFLVVLVVDALPRDLLQLIQHGPGATKRITC